VGYRGNINIKKDDFDKLVAAFSSMPVSAANGIQNIVRKRDNHNNAGDELLPILPMQFMKIDKRTFIDIIAEHKSRLELCTSASSRTRISRGGLSTASLRT
jgi:hypothetical protein